MGRRGGKPSKKLQAKAAPTSAPVALPTRDPRPYIYYGLDQLFVVVYAYVIAKVIPNRLPTGALHLWAIPVLTQAMAIGTVMGALHAARLRQIGREIALVAGSLILLTTILLIIRMLVSAAFLAGVYGAFGKAAATFALVAVALVIEVVALLPIVQIKYLMSRAGRRVYT
jgi:hypothetical protein